MYLSIVSIQVLWPSMSCKVGLALCVWGICVQPRNCCHFKIGVVLPAERVMMWHWSRIICLLGLVYCLFLCYWRLLHEYFRSSFFWIGFWLDFEMLQKLCSRMGVEGSKIRCSFVFLTSEVGATSEGVWVYTKQNNFGGKSWFPKSARSGMPLKQSNHTGCCSMHTR